MGARLDCAWRIASREGRQECVLDFDRQAKVCAEAEATKERRQVSDYLIHKQRSDQEKLGPALVSLTIKLTCLQCDQPIDLSSNQHGQTVISCDQCKTYRALDCSKEQYKALALASVINRIN
jgi:hypothetical protein